MVNSMARSKKGKKKSKRKKRKKTSARSSSEGRIRCPECGSTRIIEDVHRGEVLCANCGYILEEGRIDFSQEWREFDQRQAAEKRRTGAPTSYTKPDLGIGTKVGKTSDIEKIRKRKGVYRRIGKWQSRIYTALERNLKLSTAELRRAASILALPQSVEEEAGKIYRNAARKGLVRGRSMESVVAGAIYAACRICGVPRTLEEIGKVFPNLDKKEIGKTYRFICRELNIRILPTSPLDYVNRFATELRLSQRTITRAIKILNQAAKKEITSGKGPMGVAAAALYIASLLCGEKKTQREVADVAGVTEVTIRNRYKELIEKLNLEEEIERLKEKAGG